VGEEGEGNLLGMRHLCGPSPVARQIRSYVIVDGANTDHITTRALGSRRFEVTFSGPGGHSWSDFGVGNPIHALCRAVALFAETRLDSGPKSSVNVGLIEGGSGVNAIAQAARCKVDIRSESNARMDQLVDILGSAVGKGARPRKPAADGRPRVTVKTREDRFAPRRHPAGPGAHPAVRSRRGRALGGSAHTSTARQPTPTAPFPGHSGNRHRSRWIGGGAHTSGEWFSPDGRDLGLKRILLSVLMLMRAARGASSE
jgi:acetylornithine deacetylase/succinyl-diaminopimelate desuccinylase-like protein